ncbi:MAG: hypothetical protein AMXMBFR53_29000 [Gemmatimonadota bacterium]
MNGAMLLPEFDQEMANTRKVLERVLDDQLGFKPHEKSWTLRELAGHVSQLPGWCTATLGMTELDLSQPWEQPEFNSRADFLSVFDAQVTEGRKALEAASADDLAVNWTLKMGDEVIFSMPRAAVYRSFVMNHLIHHRAQLTIYLRLTGAPVPGMYGPSADEQ